MQQKNLDLTDIQSQIETIKEQIEVAQEEYEAAIEIREDVKTRASQIEVIRGKIDELNRLEREQYRLKSNLNTAEKEVEEAIKETPIPLMLEFVREIVDDLQRTTITTARRSGFLEQLRELIESDTCVCGRCIDETSRQYILK